METESRVRLVLMRRIKVLGKYLVPLTATNGKAEFAPVYTSIKTYTKPEAAKIASTFMDGSIATVEVGW